MAVTLTDSKPGDSMTSVQVKDALKSYVEKWKHLVTDYGWEFKATYCDSSEGMPRACAPDSPAYCQYQFIYLHGWIWFDLSALCGESEDELELCVIHELTHFLLAPLVLKNNDQNKEYCTTTISRLFQGLNNAK